MKASTKRILSILISALLMIMAIIVYSQFIRPTYAETQELRGEIQTRRKLLEDQKNAVRQVQDLISQFQSIAQLQEVISFALPINANVPQALGQYQAIAQANGLSIQSAALNYLAVKPPASDIGLAKGIGVLRFKLKLLGSYEAMKTFLQAIETNIRVSDLINLKLERAGQPGQNLYSSEIVVDNYYQSN